MTQGISNHSVTMKLPASVQDIRNPERIHDGQGIPMKLCKIEFNASILSSAHSVLSSRCIPWPPAAKVQLPLIGNAWWIRQAFGTVHQHFRTAQAQAFWDVLLARHAQFEAQSSHFGTCRTLIELQHRDIVIKHFKHFVGPNTQANTSLDANRCAVWVTNRQPRVHFKT